MVGRPRRNMAWLRLWPDAAKASAKSRNAIPTRSQRGWPRSGHASKKSESARRLPRIPRRKRPFDGSLATPNVGAARTDASFASTGTTSRESLLGGGTVALTAAQSTYSSGKASSTPTTTTAIAQVLEALSRAIRNASSSSGTAATCTRATDTSQSEHFAETEPRILRVTPPCSIRSNRFDWLVA